MTSECTWIPLPSDKQPDLLDPDPWAWTDLRYARTGSKTCTNRRTQTPYRQTRNHKQSSRVQHTLPAPQGCGPQGGPVPRTPLPYRRDGGCGTRSSEKKT